jgi:choice-of-anchor B domain-containing protein
MLLASQLVAQQAENISLVYHYDDPNLPERSSGQKYNDCWGYVGPNGEEIAIIGTLDSILFFDISDVNNVVKLPGVAFGARSTWRDFKTYENYCYAVADQGTEGLAIINMDDILAGTVTSRQETADFSKCHNIWVDTATAKLYVVGSNTESQGLIIYDLSGDPYNPTVFAQYDLGNNGVNCSNTYVHDLHVRNDTAYCNMNATCGFYVFDVSSTTPNFLGSLPTGAFGDGYNHSSWVSEDGSFAVVAEETFGLALSFVDLSDLMDMGIMSTFKDPLLAPEHEDNIAHNPFIKGNLCFVAYYHDGLQVLDVSDPTNPIRVGYYDTDTDPTDYSGFSGAWGTYPYFPSGHVIASDMRNGLFVLELDQSILAADWHEFTTAYADEKYFELRTEFQTTYTLDRVDVQWSPDGIAFHDWANIQPDKFTHRSYTWSGPIERPQAAAFYVRLQTLEKDGAFSYSPIRRIAAVPSQKNRVYPQPAAHQIQIESTEQGYWELWSLSGQKLIEVQVGSYIQSQILPSHIPSGAHVAIWRSRSGTIRDQQTVMIQR